MTLSTSDHHAKAGLIDQIVRTICDLLLSPNMASDASIQRKKRIYK